MTLPNFFILGTAKAGTTSLANYLRQHPQVFIPNNKEPNFFILENCPLPPFAGPADAATLNERIYQCSVTDLDSYQALYDRKGDEVALGDATVLYLYFNRAADRIRQLIPDARMIVVLRNPVDRLYSHFLMVKERYGLEPLDIEQALAQEPKRIAQNWGWDWHYANIGRYFAQIKYYFDLFNPEQFQIFLYEDYCRNPLGVIRDIFQHIGVDTKFIPNLAGRSKVSYSPKCVMFDRCVNQPNRMRSLTRRVLSEPVCDRLIRYANRINRKPTRPLEPEVRSRLIQQFQPDILQLQELLQRDLSEWLAFPE